MTEKLNTCPFCRGEASLVPHDRGSWCEIECLICGAKSRPFCDIISASEAWNTRPTETAGMDEKRKAALKEMPSPKMQTCLAPEWYVKHYNTIREALTAIPPVIGCEVCEWTGRTECLPDSEHTHPCDDCNGELSKEFQRGYAFREALSETALDDRLREAVRNTEMALDFTNEYSMVNNVVIPRKDAEALITHALQQQDKTVLKRVRVALSGVAPLLDADCPDMPDEESIGWQGDGEIPVTFGQVRAVIKSLSALNALLEGE